jgi:hypothetical protein
MGWLSDKNIRLTSSDAEPIMVSMNELFEMAVYLDRINGYLNGNLLFANGTKLIKRVNDVK